MNKEACALALFDFDGTLIRGDSIFAYLRHARRLGAVSFRENARLVLEIIPWLMKKKSDAELKSQALAFYFRLPESRRYALDRSFAEEVLAPRVFSQGRECLKMHRRQGRLIFLVSASTENYMQFVADVLDVDGLLCTPLADQSVGANCKGEEKVRRIEAELKAWGLTPDWDASYAYGDSASDLPMLRLCGHPTLVNPGKKLRRLMPDWPCLVWKNDQAAKNT